jgi:ribose transport system permease protein
VPPRRVRPAALAVSGVELGRRLTLPLAWVGVIALFGALEPDTFLTSANFQTIFGSQAVLAVVTLGLLIPLTAGDYDLSVASVLSLSAMVVALLNVQEGWAIGPAILAGLMAGALAGVLNGAIVVLLRVDSFITTLGSGSFISGLVLWISNSNTIGGISDRLVDPVIVWDLFGIPLAFYYALALCVVVWYMLEFTASGRRLLFVGRGRRVARLSGVRVERARWGALTASGAIAGLAGVLYAGTTGGADPSSGQTFLLPAFAGAFLGATSIVPGRFNPWGSFIAVYFLVTGVTGLQPLGAESFVQQLFYGGALIVAVALARLGSGRAAAEEE